MQPRPSPDGSSPGASHGALGPARRRLALGVLSITIFLDFMGFSVLIPVLPNHLAGLGFDYLDVGLVLALYLISMVLFLPLWGLISDRVGRRPVLLACLIGTALSFLLMVPARSLGLFYFARILQGFFGASVGTAQAYVTDITSSDERTWGIGLVGAAAGLGMVFGPALGGALYEVSPWLPFAAPAALALFAFFGAAFFLAESRTPASGAARMQAAAPGWRHLLTPSPIAIFMGIHERRVRLYFYLFFHLFAAFAALEAMFPLFASERFGWSVWEVGLFLSYIGVVMAVTQGILIRPLTRWLSEAGWVLGGLLITGTSMIGLSLAQTVPTLLVLGTAVALGYGLAYPAFTSLFTKAGTPAGELGSSLAHANAMSQTGRGVGFIAAGFAAHLGGAAAPLFAGGLGVLAGLALFAVSLPALRGSEASLRPKLGALRRPQR